MSNTSSPAVLALLGVPAAKSELDGVEDGLRGRRPYVRRDGLERAGVALLVVVAQRLEPEAHTSTSVMSKALKSGAIHVTRASRSSSRTCLGE